MSEPFIKEAGKRGSLLVKIAIGVMAAAGVTAVGLLGLYFISYNGPGGSQADQTFAQVSISSPPNGVQFEAGESLLVETAAFGSTPFQTMELWINGELLGLQHAAQGGVHPFSTYFSWRPLEPGVYSLVAAAKDVQGDKAISEQVVAVVLPSEEEGELVLADAPAVIPAPGGGVLPPEAPEGDGSTGPAGPWSSSIGGWVTSLTADEKPAAPGLTVRPKACAAELFIHDLSENEEGFAVYRQTGVSPMWVQIAALGPQAEYEWITYQDEGIYGAVSYYVAAFNSQGESESNPGFVSVDPEGCAPDEMRAATRTMKLALQVPEMAAGQVYCYLSTDGINWARWPQSGFLMPGEGGVEAEIVAMNLVAEDPLNGQALPEMDLFMDCWGWQGGSLQHLGKLAKEAIDPHARGTQGLVGQGLRAELTFETAVLPNQTDLYSMGSGLGTGLEYLLNLGLLDGVSVEIPRANLSMTFDREICREHLPPDAQNIAGQLIYCFPYPAYDLDKGAARPQPYLIWGFDFEPVCIGGVSEQCKSYWELLQMAEETGGQVGFTVLGVRGEIKTVWNVTEPNLTMFVVPPLACLGNTEFTVRVWYRPGSEGVSVSTSPEDNIQEVGEMKLSPPEILYGPYSNPVIIPCNNANVVSPSIVQYYREIEVVFTHINFYKLDDGGGDDYVISSDTNVELYGYFRIQAPSFGHWETEYCFMPEVGDCDNEPYWTGTRRYLLIADWEEDDTGKLKHVTSDVTHKAYKDLLYWEMCKASSKYSCKFEGQGTSYQTENNRIRAVIKEGDTLTIEMRLVDYDELSGDDEVCVGTLMIPSEDFIYGGFGDEHSFYLTGATTDSGECILFGTVAPSSIWMP